VKKLKSNVKKQYGKSYICNKSSIFICFKVSSSSKERNIEDDILYLFYLLYSK
jgi:hypothetical protein